MVNTFASHTRLTFAPLYDIKAKYSKVMKSPHCNFLICIILKNRMLVMTKYTKLDTKTYNSIPLEFNCFTMFVTRCID